MLHAGFYYSSDSLKARLTRDGNREWRAYCEIKGLRINHCGKLVVAHDEHDRAGLHELMQRGQDNNVELELVSAKQASDIEPRVKTHEQAIWSPTTSSVDPAAIMDSLVDDVRDQDIQLRLDEAFIKYDPETGKLGSSRQTYSAGYIVNAAGLHADRVAGHFGFSRDHRIIPFKGLYLSPGAGSYRPATNIYPVPDLRHPFLGVHFTVTVDGETKIGPTAVPALWRENYQGLQNFSLNEFFEIFAREAELFAFNRFDFRALALRELRKNRRKYMVECAARMLDGVPAMGFAKWGNAGIRAQLVNTRDKVLEMDFRVEGDDRSLHVLNAVSPAFTCAFSFARYLADRMETLANSQPAPADTIQ
ncbi:L-2-hydroxyglutarate oxidase LhgO [Methylohalomonas lacus]|uniref:L-2-hydroxyglutarate oxidase LhgO n=1 Tax=Methylohalomonas lacus TaxID=398773 RepID=A0AAE3HJX7_9GAMM|nr:L-2-hydroxyglutarate oxidase LhgO [Methylohalomonas lacus]